MKSIKSAATLIAALAVAAMVGCTSTPTQEGTQEYVDDSVITSRVKAAIFNEPSLKSLEINVETFKGVVQLSGFVGNSTNVATASNVASHVSGVTRVRNDIRLK